MIFQILIIVALAGIFIILMRRFPETSPKGTNALRLRLTIPKISFKFPAFKLPTLKLPKLRLAKFKKDVVPVVQEEDPLSQAELAFINKDFDLAEKMYIKAATLQPRDARIYARLGVIYLHQKNYKDARDALLTSLKFDPNVASRHYNLGLVYQGMGNSKKALAEVKQALSLDPSNEKYETLKQKLEG